MLVGCSTATAGLTAVGGFAGFFAGWSASGLPKRSLAGGGGRWPFFFSHSLHMNSPGSEHAPFGR